MEGGGGAGARCSRSFPAFLGGTGRGWLLPEQGLALPGRKRQAATGDVMAAILTDLREKEQGACPCQPGGKAAEPAVRAHCPPSRTYVRTNLCEMQTYARTPCVDLLVNKASLSTSCHGSTQAGFFSWEYSPLHQLNEKMRLSQQPTIMFNRKTVTNVLIPPPQTLTRNRIFVHSFTSILGPGMKHQARQQCKYSFLLQISRLARRHLGAKAAVHSIWLLLNFHCAETTRATQI